MGEEALELFSLAIAVPMRNVKKRMSSGTRIAEKRLRAHLEARRKDTP